MSAVVHPFFVCRVATPPPPVAEPLAEGGYSLVEDVYGNIWTDFTKAKYEAFTYKGIQLKRHIGGNVWRRNAPWMKAVLWDADSGRDWELEWYAQAVYLCDVDGIPDEKE